jgi:primary-amine oxidase
MKLISLSAAVLGLASMAQAMPLSQAKGKARADSHAQLSETYAKRESLFKRDETCGFSVPDPATPSKTNIFAELDENETQGAYNLLTSTFNLTYYGDATLYDNYLVWIEAIRPNKTDALSYLDSDGAAPDRYAKAVLFFGGEDFAREEYPDGYWQTYQVGPLPVTNITTVQELKWLNAKDTVAYHAGYQDDHRWAAGNIFYENLLGDEKVAPVIEAITGSPTFGKENSTLEIWWTDPIQYDEDTKTTWSWTSFFGENEFDASDILSHGLYFKANITGRDPNNYSAMKWFYGNKLYDSTEEFVDAFEKGEIAVLKQTDIADSSWTNPSYVSGGRDLDDKLAPFTVEPNGRRWRFSEEQRYFTWMDWEFYVSWTRDVGLTLYDIKFKGERILYELGLQEAIAEYSGDDPFQMNTVFLDTSYGFGNEAWGLIPGYDCPYNAEFFNVSWHSFGDNNYQNNSYCAYEFTEDYPISRHTASTYTSVKKNPTFVLRSVGTIGNYDYNFSYKFYLDGTIEVSVRAAGYIQGSYYQSDEVSSVFGYKIGETLSGSFHDHVLNYKADLDIGGTNNTISNIEFVQKEVEFPWAPGQMYNTKQAIRGVIESEDDSRLTWPANGAGALLVESSEEKNKWGSPRAYRIVPGASPVHRIVDHSITLVNQAQWANDNVAFTKQKDSEPHSSHALNAHDIYDPTVQFDKFFDSENLVGEDVVAWINLGLHHLPNTQDVPVTIFNTAQSSFILTPYNYFDNAQVSDVKQQMFYEYEDSEWEFYGSDYQTCQVEIDALSYENFNYDGVAVGKDTTNIPSP